MNILGKINEYKEKARNKRLSRAREETARLNAKYEKIKEERQVYSELNKQKKLINRDQESIKNMRKQELKEKLGFFNNVGEGFNKLDSTRPIKVEYQARNILKDSGNRSPIDDRFQPRGLFNNENKKKKSPFM